MVRPPAAPHCRSGPQPQGPAPSSRHRGGRWSQLGHQSPATPRRALQKVACCERGLSTACREGRKDNPHHREGGTAAPAEGQLRALGPPAPPTPAALPGRPAGRDSGLRRTAGAGVGGTAAPARTAGWVSWPSCRPAGHGLRLSRRAAPKLLSCQVSAAAGTLATHPGTQGRVSRGGTGRLGRRAGQRLRQATALPQRGPRGRGPEEACPPRLGGWAEAGNQAPPLPDLPVTDSKRRQAPYICPEPRELAAGASVRPAAAGPAGERGGLAARVKGAG